MADAEKLCCITMDEFAIKPSLDYDSKNDAFIGNVTLPGHEAQGKATKCLVFQIGGTTLRYKQIVGYFFTPNSIQGQVLGSVLSEIILEGAKVGLNIIVSTSDMAGPNLATWN